MAEPARRGRFITFEGGEGAGKSTQVSRLAGFLRARGVDVVTTREPGGSDGAEEIRRLLVTGDTERWSPMAETLLLYAARADHLDKTIRPALGRGAWVICDRFSDSTRAYQGAGGQVDASFLDRIDRQVVGDDQPDLTIIFDILPDAGLSRAGRRNAAGSEDRFERKDTAFHERLREAFLAIARAEPRRCVVVDAAAGIDDVTQQVETAVASRFDLAGA